MLKRQAKKNSAIEIKTIDDITDALAEIQHTVETHKNSLPREVLVKSRLDNILYTSKSSVQGCARRTLNFEVVQ